MGKFTKGEWKNNGRLIHSGATFIATASITDVEWSECEANASLIAAAPEMYEMLKSLVDEGKIFFDEDYKPVIALLAKARGEQ